VRRVPVLAAIHEAVATPPLGHPSLGVVRHGYVTCYLLGDARSAEAAFRHPEVTGGLGQLSGLPSESYTKRWQRPRSAVQAPA
jgi:hypothetical protein